MFEQLFPYFGLRENPFHVSPDPRFYFSTRSHDAAFAELQFGVDTRQGFLVLTGEAGTGKTTLLNHFLNWLQMRRQSSSYVFHAVLKPTELLEFILQDFGIRCASREKGDLLATLQNFLIERHRAGDSPVVIIDEAQAISTRTLDHLRLLLNLETPGSKLMQIVLAGQPELEEKLRRPELRQLRQRVMFRCKLQPLSVDETADYVKSRLEAAGALSGEREIFEPASLELISMYARGIPRTVNLLCEHALIAGFTVQAKTIGPEIVRRVATDFELTAEPVSGLDAGNPRFGRLVAFRAEERVEPEVEEAESQSDEEPVVFEAQVIEARTEPVPVARMEEMLEQASATQAEMAERKMAAPTEATNEVHLTEEPAAVVEIKTAPEVESARAIGEKALAAAAAAAFAAAVASIGVERRERNGSAGVAGKKNAESLPRPGHAKTNTTGAAVERDLSMTSAAPVVIAKAVRPVVTLVAKAAVDDEVMQVMPKRVVVAQGPGISERFVAYWSGVTTSFMRDWREFMGAHGPVRTMGSHASVVRLQQEVIVPITKWLKEPAKTAKATPRRKVR